MLPDLLLPFADEYKILNLFRYITFRSGGAFMTALLVSLFFGERFIAWLKAHQKASPSVWTGESHILASGTPTMGGLLILFSFIFATFMGTAFNPYLWPVLLVAAALEW